MRFRSSCTRAPRLPMAMVSSAISATEMAVEWKYTSEGAPPCYASVRKAVRAELLRGFFGPPDGGVYSPSLQVFATRWGSGGLERARCPYGNG